ncbi:MAG: sodium:solute symporter family transporter, partial [Janthinobacterium lividum]
AWGAVAGDTLGFIIVGAIFAPRMAEFLGKLSIAEAMGDLYGEKVRVITAIAGCIGAGGIIAAQLKVSGLLFEYCFGISSMYGVIIGGSIVTLYSALGGIRSVTFTDVIQLLTFGTIIPTIAFFILGTLDNLDVVTATLHNNELFDFNKVFDFSQPKAIYYLFLFLYTVIPGLSPDIFQRIAMAKNTFQVRYSFIIAGIVSFFLSVTMAWISILVMSTYPNLIPTNIVKHILFNYSYPGLTGLTLAGIMAMVMSTVDSNINSTSVLLINDFCKPLGMKINSTLFASRIASLLIGILAMIMTLHSGSLLQLVIVTVSFYVPIVAVPFIMSIFGFRSSSKSVLIGMAAGFSTVVVWDLILKIDLIDAYVPAIVSNLVFLLGSHYVLKQPGGWVGIKDTSALEQIKKQRRRKIQNFVCSIRNFNLHNFLRANSPTSEAMYAFFGLFCIISIYFTMHTIPKEIQILYPRVISFIYPSVLFMATILISYPLWLPSWKDKIAISVFWNIAVFYVLICIGFLLVIMSNFAQLQLMAFMINLIVIAVLVRWQWALVMMSLGIVIATNFFNYYLKIDSFPHNFSTVKFEATYILLLVSSILIVFLKPKQEYQQLTEEKVDHLSGRLDYQEGELTKALDLKNEFIRNISHEYHAPMTGVISTAETLWAAYEKLPDKMRKEAAENIYKSAIRLHHFDDNINSLAKLANPKHKLKKGHLNLSQLVEDRVSECTKLYIGDKDKERRDFIFNIKPDLWVECDKYYITKTLDNLIINAILYCKSGNISVSLYTAKNDQAIVFEIEDEGIGIPIAELNNIFGAFIVSSKTRTPAGGRGIGLALCKQVIEMHNGSINVESDGNKGAAFKVALPVYA